MEAKHWVWIGLGVVAFMFVPKLLARFAAHAPLPTGEDAHQGDMERRTGVKTSGVIAGTSDKV